MVAIIKYIYMSSVPYSSSPQLELDYSNSNLPIVIASLPIVITEVLILLVTMFLLEDIIIPIVIMVIIRDGLMID